MLTDKDVFIPSRKIPAAHLKTVCKYRKGANTCKYITFKEGYFYCVKNVNDLKKKIDELKDMKAKSDNCNGL